MLDPPDSSDKQDVAAQKDGLKEAMVNNKLTLLLLTVLYLGFGSGNAPAQNTSWEKHTDSGTKAFQQGLYGKAEELFLAALEEAETFGAEDLRVATSLNNLGVVFSAQGKYAEAEPLSRQALATWEKLWEGTILMLPPASATWPHFITTKANLPKPRHSAWKRWPFGKRLSGLNILMLPRI